MSSVPPPPAEALPAALPAGTHLGEFEVLRVLGIGGFGIVYLALDHALEREVAVKEYMPSALAGRTATLHVSLRSQSDHDTFELGRRSFVNEARLLARFDHPSLLKVHRFWEANGTAYMAMPVYRGPTFKKVREQLGAPPDEVWLRRQLMPLLGALATLHAEGVYHRDIAPDNIVLEADGRPVLLDFGAARRVISDKSQTLTAILKPAYAPIEQYAEAASVRQGPWTDFYALGATLHYLLLGRPPAPATTRALHDDHPPLAGQALPGCSPEFLAMIDWMLAPRPSDRPQSAEQLQAVLEGREPVPVPPPPAPPAPPPPGAWERTQVLPGRTTASPAVAAPAAAPLPPSAPAPGPTPPFPGLGSAYEPKVRSRLPLVLAGLGAVAVAAAAAWWARAPAQGEVQAAAPAASVAAQAPDTRASEPASVSAASAATPITTSPAAPPPAAERVAAPARVSPAAVASSPAASPAASRTPVRAPLKMPPNTAAASKPADTPQLISAPPPPPAPAPLPRASEPAPSSLPAAAVPVPPASPNDVCGKRLLLAWSLCMQNQCARAELRQHPECVKWRRDRELQSNPVAN